MSDAVTLFAGVAVAHFDAAAAWYGRLFGRRADAIVEDDELMWRVSSTAWLYIILDEPRAGRSQVALAVPNLDRTLADIRHRGIVCETIEVLGDAGRKATVTDPDGNSISFVEVN